MKHKYFIHDSSEIGKDVVIGKGTKIWHFCHVMDGAKIGKDCILGQNVFVGEKVIIGDKVKLQNNVSVFSGVELEDYVFCGPSVTFTNVNKPRAKYPVGKKFETTKVKKGATIGANATIVCPRTIGKYAFIGAGSVVTKDVPSFGLVYGNPAKLKGFACICGQKLLSGSRGTLSCPTCGRKYLRKNAEVRFLQ